MVCDKPAFEHLPNLERQRKLPCAILRGGALGLNMPAAHRAGIGQRQQPLSETSSFICKAEI
jgi:hypothetical protein